MFLPVNRASFSGYYQQVGGTLFDRLIGFVIESGFSMMLWVASLALWNLSPDKCYECGGGVLHCLPEVVLISARSFLIQVADATMIAMITLTLEWNIIPIYVINNAHPLNFTHDACTCIPHAHAGPELSRTRSSYKSFSTLLRYHT